jgi:D-hydroxyproline dehydrogenase subunit beta
MSIDAIIVGGGIVGCAIADRLAADGLQVTLVERDCIGGRATGASMGHLLVADEDPAELMLSAWSCERWRIEQSSLPDAADYRAIGTLWIAADANDMQVAELKQQRLAEAGISSSLLGADALAAAEPALARGLSGALLVASDAIVYPPAVARHLARRAQANGAHVLLGEAVQRIETGAVIMRDGRELRAGAIVLASGCETVDLLGQVPLRRRKGHLLISTAGKAVVGRQLVELGYARSALGDADESVAFNVQPRPNGQLLIGSTRQFQDQSSAVDPRMIRRLIERARQYLPAVERLQALRAWCGFRPTTPDHRPLIGAWPEQPGLWLACGHEGSGVTTSLGTADLLAAQIGGRRLPFDPALFAASRFAARIAHAA